MKQNIRADDPQDPLIIGRMIQRYLRSDEEYKVAVYPQAWKMAKALLGVQAVTDDDRRTRWQEHSRLERRLALAGLDSELRVINEGRWALALKQLRDTLPTPRFDEVKQQRDIAMGVTAPEPERTYLVLGPRLPKAENQQPKSFITATALLNRLTRSVFIHVFPHRWSVQASRSRSVLILSKSTS
jgi:hypothetical protein